MLGQLLDVGLRVHPHQHRVVALGDHVLVHLVRPLGGDEQVETELPALRRDLDGPLRGQHAERVAGSAAQMLWASSITTRHGCRVCRSVHSLERTAWATSPCSSAVSSDPRSTTVQRALGLSSSWRIDGWSRGPDVPLEHPEVGGAQAELPRARGVGLGELLQPGDELRAGLRLAQEVGEHGVLVPVADRVQAEDARLRLGVELGEPEPEPVVGPLVVPPDRHLVGDVAVALGGVRGRRPAGPGPAPRSRSWGPG